jgi:TonB dependent receptor-like, beta-barrel
VGLSFHTDPTKSTQYAPLVNGGSGRNINYQIDGGDNNDDTVGGQLEAFPLEAIEQFNFQTQRFKAEYGRSNGGVLSVVTKSGTNLWSGSAFEFFRDKSMNALTETEILAAGTGTPVKGDYRQNQFGGSFGGPILKDQAHFFVAVERTNQDKTQAVNTQGLFPDQDGVFAVPYRETPFSGKVTANLNANQFLSVRYGRDTNSQPYNAAPNSTFNNWGDSANKYNSFNLNHNWVMSGSKLNEFIFQYADFGNTIASRSSKPNESFPNGVTTGANGNTPQTTEQTKYQFRDDFSWHASGGGGLGHDFKVGANFINEPHLFITFNTGKGVTFNTHITNDVNGPISLVTVSDGNAGANIPMKQFATYFQDDWRVSDRLTFNIGVRYDYMVGYQIDESKNPNFVAVQAAGAAGKLSGIVGLENFGQTPQEDRNNIQPRLGAVYDLRGNGKDIVRGGWGIYTDVGYTNSNVLFAATDSTGEGFGQIFNVNVTNGIKNPDGSFYRAGQPLSNIASQNQVTSTGAFPLTGQWIDPRLQQPYQMQSNLGWSHELTSETVFAVDYVNSLGRDLNLRPRVNQRIPGSLSNPRRLAAIIPTLTPNTNGNRPTVSRGKSEYNAMVLSIRRRMSHGFDFQANYTLQKGVSTVGTAADALNTANIQDPNNPFDDPRQLGPMADVDSRHLINISASFQLPYGIRLAPIFFFRSALPVALVDGRDINLDGDATEIPTIAYAVDSFDASKPQLQQVTVKQIGNCETVNCGRGYYQTQTNLRLSKVFHVSGRANVEAIGEIFNLFNNINPSGFRTRVIVPATGVADPNLLQPATYSGDFRRPEQRVGQLGLRFTF